MKFFKKNVKKDNFLVWNAEKVFQKGNLLD